MSRGETWTEYRAVYTRPASILDKEYTGHGQAYVECRTLPFQSIAAARVAALHNSTESHAAIKYYEERTVTATEWRPGQ